MPSRDPVPPIAASAKVNELLRIFLLQILPHQPAIAGSLRIRGIRRPRQRSAEEDH